MDQCVFRSHVRATARREQSGASHGFVDRPCYVVVNYWTYVHGHSPDGVTNSYEQDADTRCFSTDELIPVVVLKITFVRCSNCIPNYLCSPLKWGNDPSHRYHGYSTWRRESLPILLYTHI